MGPILTNPGPDIFIEDEKVIDRVQSANLYRHKYNAIAQAGTFHVWTCKKDGDFFQ